jgi:hypothetical protein
MDHAPGFLKLVNEARPHVKEITFEQARERAKSRPPANNRVVGPPPVKTMLGEELGGLSEGLF